LFLKKTTYKKKMPKKLCLNMIVKNESRIMPRCLSHVKDFISYYVICDTGSDDNTVELIGQCLEGIPGEVHHEKFVNFSQARNLALSYVKTVSRDIDFDFILCIDADMIFRPSPDLMTCLENTVSCYMLRQECAGLSYYNIRLINRDQITQYTGATHEVYVSPGDHQRTSVAYIEDIDDGGCKGDKFKRDEKLLRQELVENPTDPRTMFYLAQTLKSVEKLDDAILMYQKHQKHQTWQEEAFYSRYMESVCLYQQKKYLLAVDKALSAFYYYPERYESLAFAVRVCREQKMWEMAWALCPEQSSVPKCDKHILFIEKHVYEHQFLLEQTKIAYYVKEEIKGTIAVEKLLAMPNITKAEYKLLLHNKKFYS